MRPLLSFSLLLSACAHSSLTAAQLTDLHTPVEQLGALVYTGTVTPLGSAAPVFRYERRVLDATDGTRVVTHVTFEGEEPVVLQRAKLNAQNELLTYDEVHAQRGEALHLDGGDVLVGPTLFAFVRVHLPALREGREVPLEFWSRGTPYRFTLRLVADVVEMRAASAFVALAIAPIRITLDASGQVTAYHGRIPPLVDGREVDAEVTYVYAQPFR
jgi:hypothetical protein